MLVRDLGTSVIPGVSALMLTKVDSPEHVQAVAEIVAELEVERQLPPGRLKFIALVETANGFFRIEQIAKSHPRVVGLSLGSRISPPMLACSRNQRGCSIPSSRRFLPPVRPASCRWDYRLDRRFP